MDVMFWVWLAVIVVSAIIEFTTLEAVAVWLAFGAIIPLFLASFQVVEWYVQLVVFVIIFVILFFSLRKITKTWINKNTNIRKNTQNLVGRQCKMLMRTDFETMGSLKVDDVVWSVVGLNGQTIERGEVVEIVKVDNNKLIVKKVEEQEISDDNK